MNRPVRRVLMTADTVGGVWTFAIQLADGLAARGIEVILAALGGPAAVYQRREAAGVPGLCLLESGFKLEWMEDPWRDVEASGRWLMDVAKQYEPDVVHLNSFGHGALPWRSPVILTAHSCVASWWEAVKGTALPPAWDRYARVVRQSLSSADRVTAPSNGMLEALRRLYQLRLNAPAARVILNGCRPGRFSPQQKEPFVLSAGRLWDEAKGVDTLERGASYLTWPVYLAGDQGGRAATPDIDPRCRALGRLSTEELAGYYARASIYALPARYEPFGLSVLEAALSGCALVLGDIPSLREIWGAAAAYVPPGAPALLAEAIQKLIADPALCGRMAREAGARARELTPERMTSAYLDLYENARKEHYACAS